MSALLNKNWKDLIKPSKLDVKPVTGDAKKAVVVAEPLERGFVMTLVNNECFIRRSIGEEELNGGQTLTYINHGFSLLSISMSKP